MNRRDLLMLTLGFGLVTHANAANDRFREDRYPSLFYTFYATDSKAPGIHRMRLDNRTIELTLPERAVDEFFMPEAVVSIGKDEVFQKKLRQKRNTLTCFALNWSYGIFDGAFFGRSGAAIVANIEVMEHTEVWVKDPNVTTTRSGYTFKGERPVELDYFKLDDFIRAVHPDANPNPYWVEVINGRQWVREIRWQPKRDVLADMPPRYLEYFYTPLDRRRVLKLEAELLYSADYGIPEDMPGWMRQGGQNIASVLRSLKISPPDDGGSDPLLIDPEQKDGATLVEFPARRR